MAARFFLKQGQYSAGRIEIRGDDAHHITRVLRLQAGDQIECVGEDELVYLVELEELGSVVLGKVIQTKQSFQESPLHLTLFQGLAKGDKMDLVIQKAVELGVQEIIPFTSRYTVVKLTEKQALSRQERWERIAYEAAKQSSRSRLPVVHKLHSFPELVLNVEKRLSQDNLVLLAYEGETQNKLKELDVAKPSSVSVLVGPEGGFSLEEVEALTSTGAQSLSLGPRILRTETAGLVALSLLGYRWGDLG